VIVVGNSSTGKTNIIETFARGIIISITRYSLQQHHTHNRHWVLFQSNHRWPAESKNQNPGHRRSGTISSHNYPVLIPSCRYYRNVNGALVVFDITNRQSFNDAFYWISEVRERSSESVVLGLIGNTIDLNNRRVVSRQEG
jgi:signal recognition particle receptor subunit beta